MRPILTRLAASTLLALSVSYSATASTTASDCASLDASQAGEPGTWWQDDRAILAPELFAHAAQQDVVLLGEHHDQVAHHRWQLHTLAGLAAHREKLVIGLEMLPREAQPALDAWISGELGEAAFLDASDWHNAWGFDPALYWPILHFARMEQIPLIALNIRPALRRELAAEGFEAVSAENRHHIPAPAAPTTAYRKRLQDVFDAHPMGQNDGEPNEAAFERFINAQLTWDVAMASALAEAAEEGVLAVGLMGVGHLGDGVPHQLSALGVAAHMAFMPTPASGCEPPDTASADALYVLASEDSGDLP